MAKFKTGGNSEVKITNAGGTLINLSAYIDTISALGDEVMQLDVTGFTDTGERIIAGIRTGQEFTIAGAFDNAATTGPDAVLAPLVGTLSAIEYHPIGTASGRRKFTGTALCVAYTVNAPVKERVSYECRFKMDGAISVGTN